MIQFDFDGRRAIVTGGARGIGRAVADRLYHAGGRVSIWDVNPPDVADSEFSTAPDMHHFVEVDVTSEADVSRAAEQSIAALGGVDILVNGAGVTGPVEATETFSYTDWTRVIKINLDGVFLCSRAVIGEMTRSGYGRIVNIASVAGKQGNPRMAAYSASKGGVISLTKALGLELAHSGVLVNCLTPGLVRTELLKEMSAEAISETLSRIPLGRPGSVDEVASQILWAASEECSFSTGASFDVSGGRSSY